MLDVDGKILVINGPNINMLGIREPGIYGKNTFADLLALLEETAVQENIEIEQYQSNHEGGIIDTIHAAQGGYDAIIINPADYGRLRLAKDGGNSGQYYGGGYFYGPYGNAQLVRQPGLWGLNTVVTNAVDAGTVLVGAFRQGATVVTKAGDGTRVEVVTGDHDDRTNNRVTVIVEERLALATRYPGAFVIVAA